MSTKIYLDKERFTEQHKVLLENDNFTVTLFKYPSDVAAVKLQNSHGYLIVLPFEGLMIWDAIFDGTNLKMKTPFTQPKKGVQISDSYGAFQFHSGLLANGNPGPEDSHYPHGEFPVCDMDASQLVISDEMITIKSQKEYIKGFGDHYFAEPTVTLFKNQTWFDINMTVTNMSEVDDMPLQYLVHLNYKFCQDAILTQNIPNNFFNLRLSVPDHIKPTRQWSEFTKKLVTNKQLVNDLSDPKHFNPEIVYFGDKLNTAVENAEFSMKMDAGHQVKVLFNTKEFPNVTRWILNNPDNQLAAFALPATCRTEGRLAAQKAGTLIWLKPQETRKFHVRTGLMS